MEIEFRFGYRNQIHYRLGDKIDWGQDKVVWEPYYTLGCGIRPENGNYIGEGYVECELCHRDYFVDIIIENDIIVAVKYRPDKKGYIPVDTSN